jgi:4-hydroxy-2-oxoglutarate aldolase
VYLTEKEKLQLIEDTAKNAAPDHLIVAGTGMESTRETIHLTNEAAKAGAQAALIITPFYYAAKMSDQALIQHFTKVADAVSIPVLLYNVTKFTHINISAAAIAELSQHPNIIGMKDSSGSIPQLVQYQAAADPSFQVLVGTASAWYPGLTMGVTAGIMALANCAPDECVEVQTLFDAGQHDESEALYRRLFPVNQAVTATYGVAGLKYACACRGFAGGYVRSPLPELDDPERKKIDKILDKAGMF